MVRKITTKRGKSMDNNASVTIVVVPRERFGFSISSLKNIYKHTAYPFSLVYVDCKSPRYVSMQLQTLSVEYGFKLLRHERFLSPNQARNIGLEHVNTKYVVFIDNDVYVRDGWLENLIKCAEETDAWLVGPIYMEGAEDSDLVHMAGGHLEITEKNGERLLNARHNYAKTKLGDIHKTLQRNETGYVEFHCVLAKKDIFDEIGKLDEGLMSYHEHIDLSLLVKKSGGKIFFEPKSSIVYGTAAPFKISDLPYFYKRWSTEWNNNSMDVLYNKWNLSENCPLRKNMKKWARKHRLLPIVSWMPATLVKKILRKKPSINAN